VQQDTVTVNTTPIISTMALGSNTLKVGGNWANLALLPLVQVIK
jgi:hypothetical protein